MAAAVAYERDSERDEPRRFTDRAWDGPPDLNASDEDKANYVIARYAVQNDHYAGLYRQWAKPIYFLVGKQWLRWDPRMLAYDLDTDVPEWRQQPVTNYTYAVFRKATAKLSKSKPSLEVVPPSGDAEDRDAAQIGEATLEFLWRYLKKPSKVIRAIGWLLCSAKVYFRVDWDPDAGELRPRQVLVEVQDKQDPLGQATIDVPCACDEMGEPARRKPAFEGELALDGGEPYDLEAKPELIPTGEITFDVVDPLSVRLAPDAQSDEDSDEWFYARSMPAAKAAALFDCDVDELMVKSSTEDEGDNRDEIENLLSSVTAAAPDPFNKPYQTLGSSQEEGIGERVLVIEYYREPCAAEGYPEGRHWIVAGGKKVWPREKEEGEEAGSSSIPEEHFENGEAPVPHGFWPPLIPVVDTPIPGQPNGVSLLGQVVPLNEQLNTLDGKIGEFHTMMAMGGVIWVTPEDKNIKITSEPGQVKVSKGYGLKNRPPVREKLEALPAPLYQERTVIEAKLRTVAGLSEVDMAQRPEGVTAGRAFLVLQEASDEPFMPLLLALEEALCEVGRRELVLAQRYYDEPRVLKIRGEKGKWEFRAFVGADLRDGLDVRVQAGSMYPWSKSAMWDTKMSVIQAIPQLVLRPDGTVDEAKLARYLDSGVPGLKAFESDANPDLIEIDREHAMFEAYDPMDPTKSNQLPQLGFWQNQVVHQEEHYNFLKREMARFERWPQAAQEAFLEHCRLTTEAVDMIAAQLTGQPTPPGAPGEEPPPGEPGAGAPAPAGGPRTPVETGGRKMAMTPGGGTEGRLRTPTASPKQLTTRLTAADRRAAGQVQ